MTLNRLDAQSLTEETLYFTIPVSNQQYWVDINLTGLFLVTNNGVNIVILHPNTPGSSTTYGSGNYTLTLNTRYNMMVYGAAGSTFMLERIRYMNSFSTTGTVDTITTTGTYTGTGSGIVFVVGGGNGGNVGSTGGPGPGPGGTGGQGGNWAFYYFDSLPGSAPVVIGSGGAANGGAGGASSFNSLPSAVPAPSAWPGGRGGGTWGSPGNGGEPFANRAIASGPFSPGAPAIIANFANTVPVTFSTITPLSGGSGGTNLGPNTPTPTNYAPGGGGGGLISGGGRGGNGGITPPTSPPLAPNQVGAGGGGGGGGGGVPGSPGLPAPSYGPGPGGNGGAGGAGRVWVYRKT